MRLQGRADALAGERAPPAHSGPDQQRIYDRETDQGELDEKGGILRVGAKDSRRRDARKRRAERADGMLAERAENAQIERCDRSDNQTDRQDMCGVEENISSLLTPEEGGEWRLAQGGKQLGNEVSLPRCVPDRSRSACRRW
jgi:hypothetical protein